MLRKNVAGQFVHVQGVSATTGGILSGATWTVRRCLDGTFAAATGTMTEDSTNGWYKFALSQADTNGNDVGYNFTATGAIPQTINDTTTACDPTTATNFGITSLPTTAVTTNGSLLTSGTGTAQLSVASGGVDIQTIKTNPVVNAGTITFPTTATLASTTNITAGTITTATNLTNAPTNGDFTATMKASITTAVPTVAGIATGVWQDATAGDFTTASSIGKALYISNIAPGGSGGHMISGSNAGTTTLGALTITGATTLTGAVAATNASNDIRGVLLSGTQTFNLTGSITGNLSGSVGSVTGLTASNLDTTVSSRAAPGDAMTLTGGTVTVIALAVWATIIDGTNTAAALLRGYAAALLGKASGLSTGAPVYRNTADSKNVISATTDADGNRTAVTLDLS